jgi:hypothetical protein
MGGASEEEQLLLQVGSQLEQTQDLTHSCPADMAQPGRRSVAADGTAVHQLVDMAGQRQQPGNPRDA